jgi:hypothetical protein
LIKIFLNLIYGINLKRKNKIKLKMSFDNSKGFIEYSRYKSTHCFFFLKGHCKNKKCKFYHQGEDNVDDLKKQGFHPPENFETDEGLWEIVDKDKKNIK